MASRLQAASLFDPAILAGAARDCIVKLNPRTLMRNPVIFVTEVVAALVTVTFLRERLTGTGDPWFSGQIASWLWFTVLFCQFRRSCRRGPRQGAGGHVAQHALRRDCQAPARARRGV